MSLLLAFDCSGPACSAAVARDGRVLARRFEARPRGQGERLLPMIAEVLAEAGCGYGDLERLAVTTGPGSFTGLRIGLATARALALASGLPLLGRSSFAVLAAAARPRLASGERLAVAIDSQRGDLFLQVFDAEGAKGQPLATPPEAAAAALEGPLLLAGSGAARLAEALAARGGRARVEESALLPDAAALAALAAAAPLPTPGAPPPSPLYLRPPDTTGPAPGRREPDASP